VCPALGGRRYGEEIGAFEAAPAAEWSRNLGTHRRLFRLALMAFDPGDRI
jgi:hypothetical protein